MNERKLKSISKDLVDLKNKLEGGKNKQASRIIGKVVAKINRIIGKEKPCLWDMLKNCDGVKTETIKTNDGKLFKVVNSQAKLKRATECLGVYGRDWGLKNIKHDLRQVNNVHIGLMSATFYIKSEKVSFDINNSIGVALLGGKIEYSFLKALETDTINKALKRLGLFADLPDDEAILAEELQEEVKLIDKIV